MVACRAMAAQSLNLVVTMMGAGIVGLPYALSAASFVYGCASLAFALVVSASSLAALVWLARAPLRRGKLPLVSSPLMSTRVVLDVVEDGAGHAGAAESVLGDGRAASIATYDDLVANYLPAWISLVSQIVMIVLLTLVGVLFIDVAHDSLTSTYPVLEYREGYPLRAGLCALAFLFSLPSKLESLKFTSLFGFLSLFFLLVVIVNRWVQHSEKGVARKLHRHRTSPVTFSGLVFAVTTQLGAFAAAFNVIAAQAATR